MIKKLLTLSAAVVVLAMVSAGKVSAAPKDNVAVDGPTSQYEYFCHRANAVNNPYQIKPFSTTFAEVDGNGNNDHTLHTGPVATSEAFAQSLKDQKINWGDIIPPVFPYLPSGYNWDAQGQAVYFNECSYPSNPDPEDPQANIDYSVDCENGQVKVVLTNSGDAAGEVMVNGQVVSVDAQSVEVVFLANDSTVTIVIGRQTVFDEVVTCGGRGGEEDPKTPNTTVSTPQVDAPKGGVGAGAGQTAVVAAMIASVASIAYGVIRLRKFGL